MSEKLSLSRQWKKQGARKLSSGQNFRKNYLSWYFLKVFFLRHSPLTENMRRGSDINKNIETAMVARSPYNFSLLPHALNGKLVFKERSGFRLDHSKIGQTQKYQCFLCFASWFSPWWVLWDFCSPFKFGDKGPIIIIMLLLLILLYDFL